MPPAAPTARATYDAHAAWDLHPSVSVRPEPFGALLYHFGNRRLSFVKDRDLLAAVLALPHHSTAEAAVASVTVDPERARRFHAALAGLVAGDILTARGG